MANSNPEHSHNKAKIAGEITLGAAIVGGIAVAGLQARKRHTTAKERHMSHLGQLPRGEQPRDLPPLEERLSLFDFDQSGEPTDQTRVAGLIYYLTTKNSAEKAVANSVLQKRTGLSESYLNLILKNLHQDGFYDDVIVEEVAAQPRQPEADDEASYLTASGDLVKAETMSEPLAVAVSGWASQAAVAGLQSLAEQQDFEQ